MRRSELLQRTISGVFIVAAVLSGVWYGSWAWAAVVSFFSMISLVEYYKIVSTHTKLSKGVGYIAAILVLASTLEGLQPVSIALTLAISAFLILMIEVVRKQHTGKSYALTNVGGTLSGILYVIVPWCFMLLLRSFPTGRLLLFSLFGCTWGCDVMAYLVGSNWGKIPLCNKVSPSKTLEGFIGGFMGSIVAASLLIFIFNQGIFPIIWIGFICGTLGQMGDLAESLLKREAGVKDAGNLIPGHGGALDRFDSILISALFTYVLCLILYQ